jgi:ABC-type proline/glycine betaine transport system ATPase subunit
MIFQRRSTFPWRNVLDNVAFPLEIAGLPGPSATTARAIS